MLSSRIELQNRSYFAIFGDLVLRKDPKGLNILKEEFLGSLKVFYHSGGSISPHPVVRFICSSNAPKQVLVYGICVLFKATLQPKTSWQSIVDLQVLES